jgi:hypothetical protein
MKGDNIMQRIIYLFTISLFLISCSSHNPVQQSNLSYDLEAQKNKVTKNGIDLITKPIHIESELKTYFEQDLLKYRILPVQVSISNNSTEDLYLSTEGISLIDPSHESYPVLPVNDVVAKAKKSYWRTAGWGAAFGLLGAVPSMINVSNTNKKIQADYESKVLKSGNMLIGAVTQGTVFFELPKNVTSLDGWEFKVAFKTPNNNELSTIGCCLVGQIEKRGTEPDAENNSNAN